MLGVEVLCVGKIKDSNLNKLIQKYYLRLGAFCKIKTIELPKLKKATGNEVTSCLKFDEQNILKKLDFSSFKIALCVEGVEISSEELATKICKVQSSGLSRISFLIGGAFGLPEGVKEIADLKLSFSRMTLPHQLARLFLMEQIYRAMTILNGSAYHK